MKSVARRTRAHGGLRPLSAPDQDPPVVHASQKLVTVAIVAGPAVALAVLIPLLWGHAVHLSDLVIGARLLPDHRLRDHRRLPPSVHPPRLRAPSDPEDRPGRHGLHGRRGFPDQLGGHPPSPPHVQRPPGRPPLTPPLRRPRGRPPPRPGLLPRRVAVRLGCVAGQPATPPTCCGTGTSSGSTGSSRCWAVASLAIPLGIGYVLSGTLVGALTALLWAGLVRMALLHHVTWSVNSLCHTFGRRPGRHHRPEHQPVGAGRGVPRRQLAQHPPRPPLVGPPRGPTRDDRPLGVAHPPVRAAGLGHQGPVAHRRRRRVGAAGPTDSGQPVAAARRRRGGSVGGG